MHSQGCYFLGELMLKRGEVDRAADLFRQAVANGSLSLDYVPAAKAELKRLSAMSGAARR
jgi:lipoprotein NlpI